LPPVSYIFSGQVGSDLWLRNAEGVETDALAYRIATLLPFLDERQRRIYLAVEAKSLGRGGIARVSRASDVRADTISKGILELESGEVQPEGPVRRPGGGRKSHTEKFPELSAALEALVDPETRGDPMSPLKWTTKSTRNLQAELKSSGYSVSHELVAQLLGHLGYSLQGNVKTQEGSQHIDRDAQFKYINERVQNFLDRGLPVVSIDAKKKELIGNFKKAGQEWEPEGEPVETEVHDFEKKKLGKAIPYGLYDLGRNEGWINVGVDHDTSAFAVSSIRQWWSAKGSIDYPNARELLITADGGGSNDPRRALWKRELHKFAVDSGLSITVCHLPPGTSKWNKIEHRLFSHITMNWRGRPLTSHEVVLNTIAATTTRTGLRVSAQMDLGKYPTGIEVSKEELKGLNIRRNVFHGEWNYEVNPSS